MKALAARFVMILAAQRTTQRISKSTSPTHTTTHTRTHTHTQTNKHQVSHCAKCICMWAFEPRRTMPSLNLWGPGTLACCSECWLEWNQQCGYSVSQVLCGWKEERNANHSRSTGGSTLCNHSLKTILCSMTSDGKETKQLERRVGWFCAAVTF